MIGRVLAIARAALVEALRARLTPFAALALLAAVPVLTWLFGDPDNRAWLARAITSEGLRVMLPLAAIIGGGFLLKPAVKRGWTILPARRAEYFAGAALAGALVLTLAGMLFAGGGLLANAAFGEPLMHTRSPGEMLVQRVRSGQRQFAPGEAAATTWVDPADGLELALPVPVSGQIDGTIEYQFVWTTPSAMPSERVPIAVFVQEGDDRRQLTTTVQSRYRVAFTGKAASGALLVIAPTDPVLRIGTSPDRVRFNVEQEGALVSVLTLLALSISAAVLTLAFVLLVRALSTAPTAVLAGLLLLATLTLLPSLAPAGKMARDRRAAMTGREGGKSMQMRAADLPPLYPARPYDEFLAARVVPGEAWADAGWRLLIACTLLPIGATLFRLREIR